MKTSPLHLLFTFAWGVSGASHGTTSGFDVRFNESPPLISGAAGGQLRRRLDNATQHGHLQLRRVPGSSSKSYWLHVLAGRDLRDKGIDADGPANSTRMIYHRASQYVGNISFGNEEFQVVMDTGSSDTWIVHEDFLCVDFDSKPILKKYCDFGPRFKGTFSHGTIPGLNFSILYGDGEHVKGSAGYEDVTVAGITVKKQRVGLVRQVYGGGDGATSGFLGLAYPLLTHAFNGANDTDRLPGSLNQDTYDTVFTSMVKQGLVTPPYFSMSMDRNHSGWLTLGAIPPVTHGTFSKTPIIKAEVYNVSSPIMETEYSFYTIVADEYIIGSLNASNITIEKTIWSQKRSRYPSSNQFPVVVDSGSTLAALPSAHAEAYASQFSPPAVLNVFTGEYWTACTSKIPQFGVVIGGQTFFLYDEDLLRQDEKLDWNGDGIMFCRLGVRNGYEGPYVLGDVFLNRVVTVFDVGIGEMHFAPRI